MMVMVDSAVNTLLQNLTRMAWDHLKIDDMKAPAKGK